MPGVVTIENSAFIARYHPSAEGRSEFEAIFDKLWRESIDFMNAQCNFVFYGWDRSNEWFYTIESYKDEPMLDTLRQSDIFRDMVHKMLSLCDQPMEFQLLRGMQCDASVFGKYPAGPSTVHPKAGNIGVEIS